MAEKYCDHGAYYRFNPLNIIFPVPDWGIAQDGDGTSEGLATSAICSITFSGVPSSGAVSVCGISISTTGVTGAASASAAANQLAANINSVTGLVSTGQVFNASIHQLRNCVYARGPADGAPAGTCEIMSRAGSAAFNGATGIAYTLNNVSGSTTWAGGAGGCWGCATNLNRTNGVANSIANYKYGVLAQQSLIGIAAPGDVVRFRTDMNASVIFYASDTGTLTGGSFGNVAGEPVTFLFDNGSSWGGGPNGVFVLGAEGNKGNTVGVSFPGTCHMKWRAGVTPSGRRALRFYNGCTSFQPAHHFGLGILHGRQRFERIELCTAAGATAPGFLENPSGGGQAYALPTIFESCVFRTEVNGLAPWKTICNRYVDFTIQFRNCLFEWVGTQTLPVPTASPVSYASSNSTFNMVSVEFEGCSWTGLAAGIGHPFSMPHLSGRFFASVKNCLTGGITDFSQSILGTLNPSAVNFLTEGGKAFEVTSLDGSIYYFENYRISCSWAKDTSTPFISDAQLWDGTPFSVVINVATAALNITPLTPVYATPLTKINPVGPSVLTASIEFLIDQNIPTEARKRDTYWFELTYIASDNVLTTDSTYIADGESLDLPGYISTAPWNRTDMLIAGTSHYFDKRKLSLTTSKAVKADSPVSLKFAIGTVHPTLKTPVILCPEFGLTA